MKYKSKKLRKKLKRMKDPYEDPMEKTKKKIRKRLTLLSTGGKVERSHKNVVGNVANKNIEKRYNIAAKALERIENEKKKRLKEEWKDSVKIEGKMCEIFVNPSLKEMDEASVKVKGVPYLRFIAMEKGKKFYIFDPSFYHTDIDKIVSDRELKRGDPAKDFWGTAYKEKGKWYYDGSDSGHGKSLFKRHPWVKKYIVSGRLKRKIGSILPSVFKDAKRERLKEEWVTTTKSNVEIFVNPSSKEMDDASLTIRGKKYIRFIALPGRKVYVFEPHLFHVNACDYLNKKGIKLNPSKDWWGSAVKKRGKWYYEGSDNKFTKDPFKRFPWLSKYFEDDGSWKKTGSVSIGMAEIAKDKKEKMKEK